MNAHTSSSLSTSPAARSTGHDLGAPASAGRPGRGRRTAVALAAFVSCAMPVVFTVNVTRMLLTGVEPSHRFHQATGQGLLLFALWLSALLPLVRAGWGGHRPTTRTGYLHVAFVVTGIACAAIAPGGGAPYLVGVIAVTGALLWWALPARPELVRPVQVDPLLAPFGFALAAFLTPYAVHQLSLQNSTTNAYHLQNPHLFDMAWLASSVVVLAVVAALVPVARGLVGWAVACCTVLGVAGLAFGQGTAWSVTALGFGLAGAGLLVVRRRLRH